MKLWFTSDTHFSHSNIIKYCRRPFKTLEDMDKRLINNWNERVKDGDMVIFLGDFMFRTKENIVKGIDPRGAPPMKWKDYRKQLNGEIVFVQGNHDSNNSLGTNIKSLVIEYGGKEYYCVHDPYRYSMGYDINLVGHIHEKWKVRKVKAVNGKIITLVNVGVDVNNFRPIDMEDIFKSIKEFDQKNIL